MPLKVLTWLWQQKRCRSATPTAREVNRWAARVRQHLTIPHTLACVTDIPEGLDADIEPIPLPHEFDSLQSSEWLAAQGKPQCLKRLRVFAPDAASYFGSDEIVSMSPSTCFVGNANHLFADRHPFQAAAGLGPGTPYSGAFLRVTAGARPQVYNAMLTNPERTLNAAAREFVGDDQSVMAYILGRGEATWDSRDGVYFYTPKFEQRTQCRLDRLPVPPCVVICGGVMKPYGAAAQRFAWLIPP